jgi:hypothetical protein
MHRQSMYDGSMTDELDRFVASLAIPADRKAVVLAELLDHVASARETALREHRDPDAAERAALGNLDALRRSLEAVEPGFRVTRWSALVRGVVAGVLVAIVLDQGGPLMMGVAGALVAVALAALCAPPRALDLLRAELRAPRIRGAVVRGGRPIGPALAYGFTVLSMPFLVWMGLIVVRARAGVMAVHVPWSAFAVIVMVYGVLLVEAIRARRKATA